MEEMLTKQEVFEQMIHKSGRLGGNFQLLAETLRTYNEEDLAPENMLEQDEAGLFTTMIMYQGYLIGRFHEKDEVFAYSLTSREDAANIMSKVYLKIRKEG